ncbi:MAG: selenocysteine-specific translation elongation factor, partial [Planctomycetota bacterium]
MTARTLVLGTAGHIDHGKTSLIRALTGVDTDRLPQEQARGMTIDIGFAELSLGEVQLGVIDVPGHERFIKNMLAGAATIDMALIVVASDDSVMPQTREHVEILHLLGIRHAVVALSKCDLRDDEWLEMVEEDVRELLDSTPLAASPLVRTATPASGPAIGIDQLKQALAATAALVQREELDEVFRLCVDRSFSVPGRGTVVTGTVASGRVAVSDKLQWMPVDRSVAVRGVHNHGRSADDAVAGQRAAINLTGVRHQEIERGHVLASPGLCRPAHWLSVELRTLASSPWPLKHRGRYRLHIGA